PGRAPTVEPAALVGEPHPSAAGRRGAEARTSLIYTPGTRCSDVSWTPDTRGPINAARPGPRPDPRRREGLAPRALDARAQQAGGAVRRPLPHRRFRPLELRELPDPLALRPGPVHVAVPDRASPHRVADHRPGAGPLHRGGAAADAD